MMAADPSVSVGMPAYNGEKWIRQAIESILNQTYPCFELVICDNASTDGTERICREYAERDPRVRYYRNPENVGLNENYNLAFRRGSGKYFKWASSNDICAPQLLERCVNALEMYPDVVLCYGRTRLLSDETDDGEPYADNLNVQQASPCDRIHHIFEHLGLNNAINGLIRTNVLACAVPIGDYFASDIVVLMELALHGKFLEVPEDLFFRRMTTETATKLKSREVLLEYHHPGHRNHMLFQHWKRNWGHLTAAARAPLAARDRICVYRHLLRRALWDRGNLAKDLWLAARTVFGPRRIMDSKEGRLRDP